MTGVQRFTPGNWVTLDKRSLFINLWESIGRPRSGPSSGTLDVCALNFVIASVAGADGLHWHLLLTSQGELGWVWQSHLLREIQP